MCWWLDHSTYTSGADAPNPAVGRQGHMGDGICPGQFIRLAAMDAGADAAAEPRTTQPLCGSRTPANVSAALTRQGGQDPADPTRSVCSTLIIPKKPKQRRGASYMRNRHKQIAPQWILCRGKLPAPGKTPETGDAANGNTMPFQGVLLWKK